MCLLPLCFRESRVGHQQLGAVRGNLASAQTQHPHLPLRKPKNRQTPAPCTCSGPLSQRAASSCHLSRRGNPRKARKEVTAPPHLCLPGASWPFKGVRAERAVGLTPPFSEGPGWSQRAGREVVGQGVGAGQWIAEGRGVEGREAGGVTCLPASIQSGCLHRVSIPREPEAGQVRILDPTQ